MIITCFPVRIWDATWDSLAAYAPDAGITAVDPDDFSGAWDQYKAHWGTDDLMIVEQDIILHHDVIPQFESCREPWCLFPFRHPAGDHLVMAGTGCNRYRLEFQQQVPPQAVEAVGGSCWRCKGINRGCWNHIEGRLLEAGGKAGFAIHVHWPSVGHREYPPGEYPE